MTLLLVALFWFLFALAAGSLIGKCIDFDLLAHSEGEQEGRAAAGRPPNQLVAARALGNAKNKGAAGTELEDTFCRSLFFDWVADDRPLLTLVNQTRPATYPDGTRDETTRSIDVFADLAAAPGDDTPDAA